MVNEHTKTFFKYIELAENSIIFYFSDKTFSYFALAYYFDYEEHQRVN